MTKIKPTKKLNHYKKYNCSGKLRVDVHTNGGEIVEVVLMPDGGGCKYNLQLIGRLLTFCLECNIDIHCILDILEKNDPCPTVVARMNREKLPKEECGLGGCAKIVLGALKEKIGEVSK